MRKPNTVSVDTTQLVDGPTLLLTLFPEGCRPTTRWLITQRQKRIIPHIRIGGLVFYDVGKVRDALAKRHTVRAL